MGLARAALQGRGVDNALRSPLSSAASEHDDDIAAENLSQRRDELVMSVRRVLSAFNDGDLRLGGDVRRRLGVGCDGGEVRASPRVLDASRERPCGESARRQRYSLHEPPSTRRLIEIPG